MYSQKNWKENYNERFIDTENFTIEQSSPSGIGPTTEIRFDLFEKSDTKIDVTDVSTW